MKITFHESPEKEKRKSAEELSESFGAILPYGRIMQQVEKAGIPITYARGVMEEKPYRAVEAERNKNFPNVEISSMEPEERAKSNAAIGKIFGRALGIPVAVYGSHGYYTPMEKVAETINEQVKRGEISPEKGKELLAKTQNTPGRIGASYEIRHRSPVYGGTGKTMTSTDMVRHAQEVGESRGAPFKAVILSQCARGGCQVGEKWEPNKELLDSISVAAKNTGQEAYFPMGATSSDSRRTSFGMIGFFPNGEVRQTDMTDVISAVRNLRNPSGKWKKLR